jgi:hypothetical protein
MRSLLFAAMPTPTTDPSETFYGPGVLGFIFTFLLAGLAILLMLDMVRRMRRVRYRAEVRDKLAAEAADNGPKGNK